MPFYFPIGMPSASLLVNLLSALFIPSVAGETEIRFAGQTEFVVNETSTTVIRLVIERIGNPANVTAVVSVRSDGSSILTEVSIKFPNFSGEDFFLLFYYNELYSMSMTCSKYYSVHTSSRFIEHWELSMCI